MKPADGAIAMPAFRDAAAVTERDGRAPSGWLRVVGVAAVASAVVVAAGHLHSHALDVTAFRALNGWRGLPDWVWAWFGVAGYGVCALAIGAVCARSSPRTVAALLWFAAVGGAATHVVKRAYPTPRPSLVLAPETFHVIGDALYKRSMPSGHTVAATGVAIIVCLAGGAAWRRPWAVAAAAALATGVGLSRIATGAHWPSDVLAGTAVGLGSGYVSVALARWSRLEVLAATVPGRCLVALVQIGAAIAVLTADTDGLDGRILQGALAAIAVAIGAYSLVMLARGTPGGRAEARE